MEMEMKIMRNDFINLIRRRKEIRIEYEKEKNVRDFIIG